jgi:hypothetical protein
MHNAGAEAKVGQVNAHNQVGDCRLSGGSL